MVRGATCPHGEGFRQGCSPGMGLPICAGCSWWVGGTWGVLTDSMASVPADQEWGGLLPTLQKGQRVPCLGPQDQLELISRSFIVKGP